MCQSKHPVLDNNFFVSKCSCVLADVYSIYYIIVSHIKEERRLTAFKNKLLRRVFGPKREEVTGDL